MVDYTDLGQNALNDKYPNRICVLWYKAGEKEKIGTGNLFEFSGNQFIITCEHVASEFFKASEGECKFAEKETIYRNNLELVYADGVNDLAIMKLKTKLDSEDYFTYNDIEVYEDFGDSKFDKSTFYVCGIPSELTDFGKTKRYTNKFSFLTLAYGEKKSTSEYLFLDYPKISGDVEIDPALDTLPEPRGMSGSFVILVPSPILDKENIWSLDKAKVVAMLTMSDNRKYVKCANIKHLLEVQDRLV